MTESAIEQLEKLAAEMEDCHISREAAVSQLRALAAELRQPAAIAQALGEREKGNE